MFRVRWKQSALNELAALWLAADSEIRTAINTAVQSIDELLRLDPEGEGESRPNKRRILFVAPLGVLFRVRVEQSVVRVLQVWRF